MKSVFSLILLGITLFSFAQQDDRISTVDFIQVLNGNKTEALFYYRNNWEELRKAGIDKGYINSYQLLETSVTEEEPFQFMLITTYANQAQYAQREEHFQELIKAQNGLKLMNDKQASDFRKTLFRKEITRHWN